MSVFQDGIIQKLQKYYEKIISKTKEHGYRKRKRKTSRGRTKVFWCEKLSLKQFQKNWKFGCNTRLKKNNVHKKFKARITFALCGLRWHHFIEPEIVYWTLQIIFLPKHEFQFCRLDLTRKLPTSTAVFHWKMRKKNWFCSVSLTTDGRIIRGRASNIDILDKKFLFPPKVWAWFPSSWSESKALNMYKCFRKKFFHLLLCLWILII